MHKQHSEATMTMTISIFTIKDLQILLLHCDTVSESV